MSKLKSKAQKSKLQQIQNDQGERIIQLSQKSKYPRSYRFDVETINLLKELVEKVNVKSKKPVSETELLKVLVRLGKKSGTEKLLKILKETSY
jgi:hypothetical protein